MSDFDPPGPFESAAGNWQYNIRGEDDEIVAQVVLAASCLSEEEADVVADKVRTLIRFLRETREPAKATRPYPALRPVWADATLP